MSERRQFILRNEAIKNYALQQLSAIQPDEEHPPVLEQREMTRTLEQNAKMWAVLDDISKQVDWHGEKLSSEDWKHVLTASLKKQKAVPGIDGGFVVLGVSTKKMKISEMRDLIELAHAFGAEHDVDFSYEAELAINWARGR